MFQNILTFHSGIYILPNHKQQQLEICAQTKMILQLSFYNRYFFEVLAVLIFLGVINGLILLPVVLSLIGPSSEVTVFDNDSDNDTWKNKNRLSIEIEDK